MSSLRSRLLRLASEKPELRDHLLPLLSKRGKDEDVKVTPEAEENLKKMLQGLGRGDGSHGNLATPDQKKKLLINLQKMMDSGATFRGDDLFELGSGAPVDGEPADLDRKYKKYKGYKEVSKILDAIMGVGKIMG